MASVDSVSSSRPSDPAEVGSIRTHQTSQFVPRRGVCHRFLKYGGIPAPVSGEVNGAELKLIGAALHAVGRSACQAQRSRDHSPAAGALDSRTELIIGPVTALVHTSKLTTATDMSCQSASEMTSGQPRASRPGLGPQRRLPTGCCAEATKIALVLSPDRLVVESDVGARPRRVVHRRTTEDTAAGCGAAW